MKKGGRREMVTLEKLAAMVANGFSVTEKHLETFKEETEKNFVKVRNDILGLDDRFIPRHEFETRMKMIGTQLERQGERISRVIDRR